MRCLVFLFLILTLPACASDFVKDQLYACAGSAIRSTLAVGSGYAIGRLFGHEHAGACIGVVAIVASKEYPYGVSREIGYCAPIAFVGWYCYNNMRKKLQEYRVRDHQGEERLKKCDEALKDLHAKSTDIKDRMKGLLDKHYGQIDQLQSTSNMPRSNSCPSLALKAANSFGQKAMNELY